MAIDRLDEASAMADSVGTGLVAGGDEGFAATWAKESVGSIFVISITLECRTSRIKADGFGEFLVKPPHGADWEQERTRGQADTSTVLAFLWRVGTVAGMITSCGHENPCLHW
jgi:hypothetical protein